MTDSVASLFERIIRKLPNCAVEPLALPVWVLELGGQKAALKGVSLAEFCGRYLGAYVGQQPQQTVYFLDNSIAFTDANLQFPVLIRYRDFASQEQPELASGVTKLRIFDNQGLLSTLNIVGALPSQGDVHEVARFIIRVAENITGNQLVSSRLLQHS